MKENRSLITTNVGSYLRYNERKHCDLKGYKNLFISLKIHVHISADAVLSCIITLNSSIFKTVYVHFHGCRGCCSCSLSTVTTTEFCGFHNVNLHHFVADLPRHLYNHGPTLSGDALSAILCLHSQQSKHSQTLKYT